MTELFPPVLFGFKEHPHGRYFHRATGRTGFIHSFSDVSDLIDWIGDEDPGFSRSTIMGDEIVIFPSGPNHQETIAHVKDAVRMSVLS